MGNYNVTITNEGAALLASVIANQGTITFTEARLSETNYVGQEQTLTKNTFLGTFKTTTVAASVTGYTQITLQASFSNSGTTEPHDMYSVGIIGTDGNTTALVCVLTTSNPDNIEPTSNNGTGSYYAFKTLLTVSSTSDITVVGTTAAALYDTDSADNLVTVDPTKVLSANMGHAIADNLAANENVYGAKNLVSPDFVDGTKTLQNVSFVDNGNGTITISGTAQADIYYWIKNQSKGVPLKKGTYILNGCPVGGSPTGYNLYVADSNGNTIGVDIGNGAEFTLNNDDIVSLLIYCKNSTAISSPITFKPMLRDARIIDDTFAPYAETNLQLTRKTSGVSNRNFVDNPFFTVNQRGTSGSYQNGYMADRWFGAGFISSNITTNITNNGAVIQSNGTYGWRVKQNIENYKDLSGRKVTYSINVKSISSGFISLFYAPSLNGINEDWVWLGNVSTTGITSATFTLPDLSSASGLCLMFQSDTPIDVTIRAVKLEPGSVSTLANDVAPNDAFELAKCRASTADPSDTYANKGNLVNYADLTTIHATGSTNTTGAQINAGSFFYLNGTFCKATSDIAANATFTLNTNFKVDSVGKELKTIAFNSPLRKPLDPNSSVSYTVPNGVYLVTSCQYGISDDFSGLWIAFVTSYATGCSVFPLVTPNYITVSVSADTITIANSDSTFQIQTNITCITEEIS